MCYHRVGRVLADNSLCQLNNWDYNDHDKCDDGDQDDNHDCINNGHKDDNKCQKQ